MKSMGTNDAKFTKLKFVFLLLILQVNFSSQSVERSRNYNFISDRELDNYLIHNLNPVLPLEQFSAEEINLINFFTRNENLPNKDNKDSSEIKKLQSTTYFEKILKAGFEFEEHKVVTDDGYILSVWRIPRKIKEDPTIRKKPIVLQHGLLDDSWTFFALNSTDCLPFILANHGYDIWLPNSRGNMFSSEHINPEYDSSALRSKYWNFTWNEMAQFDLPAVVEYIKLRTGYEKISWVGHSQGTFQFYLSFALRPDYMNTNIEKFVSIGTVTTVFYSPSAVLKILSYTKLADVINKFLTENLMDIGTSFSKVTHFFCSKLTLICKIIINLIIETKITNRVDWKEISDLYYYEPGGTSTKNLLHWIQLYREKTYSMYNYGEKTNIEVYGNKKAPIYNTDNWKRWDVESFITASDSDPFSTDQDFEWFFSQVKNKERFYIKKMVNYNHCDYMWSSDARKDLYDDVVKFLFK